MIVTRKGMVRKKDILEAGPILDEAEKRLLEKLVCQRCGLDEHTEITATEWNHGEVETLTMWCYKCKEREHFIVEPEE